MSARRLTPSPRDKVWGREHLAPWFPDPEPGRRVGEVWYEPGADCELPLLVKLIFTSEKLSLQLHPDDGEGCVRGKTEMWHILEADPGASVALGFRETITRDRLVESAKSGEIEQLVEWMPVRAGETYFTPAHTVHAIGAGIVLCEIQQNCDITYRLFDYGRPRELHLDQAAPIADLGPHPGPVPDGVVRSKYFVTEPITLPEGTKHRPEPRRCHLWICLEGTGAIDGKPFTRGEVWLLDENATICTDMPSRFLRTYVP
jgi:mannose-6-phosphate isomerase